MDFSSVYLIPVEEKEHAAAIRAAEDCELAVPSKSDVVSLIKEDAPSKAVVDARWALPWKIVDCRTNVKARVVPEGYGFPDLKDDLVGNSGRAS